jgi:methyl-accepting chemotaxis protein
MATTQKVGIFSIRNKIIFALLIVFSLVLVTAIIFTQRAETRLVDRVVLEQVRDATDSYFDSTNILMLTGTIQNRKLLQEKILSRPGITEARIVRGPELVKTFGPGNSDQAPEDELDRRGINGERIEEIREIDGQRLLTIVHPMRASKDYRGTNCLMCHAVPEGTVLGAVRMSYSLDALDAHVASDVRTTSVILIAVFIIGIILIVLLLQSVIVKPINYITSAIHRVAHESDLSIRAECASKRNDEIAIAGKAFNDMIANFQKSIEHVRGTTDQLSHEADHIKAVSETTANSVTEQRSRTDSIATAVNEMEHSAHEVKGNAEHTADASQEANQRAVHGQQITQEAIQAITELSRSVTNAAGVINELDEQSQRVGAVLDVIRGISEQTNLLALNAAIEAARAGEMGRGFAVVADEVRTLASRTHDSTEEIQKMIEALQRGAQNAVGAMEESITSANQGVTRVEDAAAALNDIVSHVEQITTLNTQMATAAEEQSYVAEEINRNIIEISQLADSTENDATRTIQVSENLVRLSNQLEALVASFRL